MTDPAATHEQSDASFAAILWFGIGLMVTLVLLGYGTIVFEQKLQRGSGGARANRIGIRAIAAPPPELQSSPQADLKAMRAATQSTLHSYGWIDPQRGVIRLPVERAMTIVVERGLPARAPASPKPAPP